MYEKNIGLLRDAIHRSAFIIPIQRHRDAQGNINLSQFQENWERQMEPFEKIPLWEKAPEYDDRDPLQKNPYLVFIPAEEEKDGHNSAKKGTILVAHGGGFQIRTGCEGPNVAWYFHQKGYNTAILTYRLSPYTRFDAIADMQRAIRLLRQRRQELGIRETITVMGFSAGGMLCGNCATHFDAGNPSATDPVERQSCRPDGAVIGYGAITGVSFPAPFMTQHDFAHDMCGLNMKDRLYLATEKCIRYDSPPFFLWQTLSDDGRYGLNLAKALSDAAIPYELHIFEGGTHGVGMADGENDVGVKDDHITHWGELCDEWMQMHGLK